MDRRSLFILTVLVAQLLLPLRYYLISEDPYDERFAWRMFSPVRMLRCEARFSVDGQPVELLSRFHSAWGTLVKRGRLDVTRAVGARLCLVNPGEEVRLRYRCKEADGELVILADSERDVCPEGRW